MSPLLLLRLTLSGAVIIIIIVTAIITLAVVRHVQVNDGSFAASQASDAPKAKPRESNDGWKSDLMLALEGKSHRAAVLAPKSAKEPVAAAEPPVRLEPPPEWKINQLQQEVVCVMLL